ncbi:MAG: hypothetical protein ABI947_26425 [Chloroflexota bacterium]
MGIDHVIDLDCVPKQTLSTMGLLSRLKARDRAATIQKLYRDNGDNRPPSEMGFEMVRRLPDGTEETQIVIVQDMIDAAAQLEPLGHHCEGCPANRTRQPFGCFGNIAYPISRSAELWLINQLPSPDDPLIFLLLSQTMRDFKFDSEQIAAMRVTPGIFFETDEHFVQPLEDAQITSTQIFAMLFLTGSIQPPHGALLLVFFGAIPRDIDADALMSLTQPHGSEPPFLLRPHSADDESIAALQAFFETLYIAHRLNVSVSLDV